MKHDADTGKTSIRIFHPKPEESGPVRVVAENIHGTSEASAKLSVQIKPDLPRFLTDMDDRQINEGDNVKFSATIEGLPEPDVQWTFNGEPITAQYYFILFYILVKT